MFMLKSLLIHHIVLDFQILPCGDDFLNYASFFYFFIDCSIQSFLQKHYMFKTQEFGFIYYIYILMVITMKGQVCVYIYIYIYIDWENGT
jgi:hypothetical protein